MRRAWFMGCSFRTNNLRTINTMVKHKRPNRAPAQKKPLLTHFLCLPLVTPKSQPQLEASIAAFKDAVTLHRSNGDGPDETSKETIDIDGTIQPVVHPKAIRPVGALHCTLGVMSLNADDLAAAVDLLDGLDIQALLGFSPNSQIADQQPREENPTSETPASLQRSITPPPVERSNSALKVDLKGLESMHAPQQTSILYTAPSDESGRLYDFCLALQKIYKDKGLLVEDNRALKLHATIVNTIYAKGRKRPQRGSINRGGSTSAPETEGGATKDDRSLGHGPNANAPLKIDATEILEKYEDFVWAENVILDRVAICEMGAKKVLDDQGNIKAEEYTEVASIALPT